MVFLDITIVESKFQNKSKPIFYSLCISYGLMIKMISSNKNVIYNFIISCLRDANMNFKSNLSLKSFCINLEDSFNLSRVNNN